MSPFLSFVRRLRPIDLLLPVGAALVSAGLQHLADREARQRARLDELAGLAGDHLQAFAAAGVAVPDELAADEPHPLDPGVAWLPALHGDVGTNDEPEQEKPGLSWKGAAVALAVVTGIAWSNREKLQTRFGFTMPWPPASAVPPESVDLADYASVGGESVEEMCPEPHCRLKRHPGKVHQDIDDFEFVTNVLGPCGWPNCDYQPDPKLEPEEVTLALAVHRNQCIFRPAGAHVPVPGE